MRLKGQLCEGTSNNSGCTKALQIFVQCDSDLMLARRLRRDVKERGRTVDGTLDQYDPQFLILSLET